MLNFASRGLPPFHPLVLEQGFDPNMVDNALRRDAAEIVEAGYNLRGESRTWRNAISADAYLIIVVLAGPEQDVGIYADRLKGRKWQGTGVGYGVRGTRLPDLTIRLEGPYRLKGVHRHLGPSAHFHTHRDNPDLS